MSKYRLLRDYFNVTINATGIANGNCTAAQNYSLQVIFLSKTDFLATELKNQTDVKEFNKKGETLTETIVSNLRCE